MHDDNQAPPPGSYAPGGAAEAYPPPPDSPGLERPALSLWLVMLVVCGAGGLVFGMQELAGLVAVSGIYVAAQAADVDPRWRGLYVIITLVVAALGALAGGLIAFSLVGGEIAGPLRRPVMALALATAGFSLLTVLPPVPDRLSRLLFPGHEPSNTLRLTAVIVALTLLLTLPAWFAFRALMDLLVDDPSQLLKHVALGGELIGYALLALASVGFLIRRDLGAALERLGLRPVPASQLALVALGVIALYALNAGAEWMQSVFFPDLWRRDQEFNQALASNLDTGRILLLGLSAGIGEEVTLRGALQPKLGLFKTSLLFACLHVQYSWFGMLVIFALGLMLGTLRMRTSTTVAIAVHAIYDILAVLSL